jgi:hypothetical protein
MNNQDTPLPREQIRKIMDRKYIANKREENGKKNLFSIFLETIS